MSARSVVGVAALLLALSGPAMAGLSPPGVNIRWDSCYGDGGIQNKVFACNTNLGNDRLVLSFELDTPVAGVIGNEIVVDIASASASLPA